MEAVREPSDVYITQPDGAEKLWYRPLPHQKLFHESHVPNVLLEGGRGSGKSEAIRKDAILRCLASPGYQCLILRREFPELRRTHLQFIDREMKDLNAGYFHKTDSRAVFDNGSSIVFGSCETDSDVLKYLSSQYHAIYFDELSTFTLQMFLQISSSARAPENSGLLAIVRAGTNPLGEGAGWVKDWFIDKVVDIEEFQGYHPADFEAIHSTFRDNPYLDRQSYESRLATLPDHIRRAWLDGEWVNDAALFDFRPTKDGQPYHVANELPHVDGQSFLKLPWIRIYRSYDHGWFPDPAVCLWHAVVGNRLITFKEKLWYRTLATDIARDIIEESRGMRVVTTYCDPTIDLNTGSSVETIFDQMERAGLPLEKSVNDRELAAHAIHSALGQMADERTPRWTIIGGHQVGFGCPYLVKTLPQMRPDKKNPHAIADHKDDHGVITAAYFLMTHLSPTSEPTHKAIPQWMRGRSNRVILGNSNVRRS
jgi:hypothetical protein